MIFSFLPVLVAQDVATTSSCCDILMAEINEARQRHGPEANLVITWLESSLKNLVRLPSSHRFFVIACITTRLCMRRTAGKGSAS